MKKVLLVLLLLMIGYGGYILYDTYFQKQIPKLNVEEEIIDINDLFIYGTHFNMSGDIVSDNNLDLVLYNGEFLSYKINISNGSFNLSDYINEGIDLEAIPIGTYYAFLRSSSKDEEDNDVFRYYVLNNNTKYDETVYYTFSNIGNKIVINSDLEYNTITFNVTKNTESEIYDVVIDPGHGGKDSGANKNGKSEADYTMKIAAKLKEKLEENGVKVKLTREVNQLSSDKKLPDYGVHGRAVINHEVGAKYVFSIHLNSNSSTNVNGIEIYTADNINYDFVKDMVNEIVNKANTNFSSNKINKVFNGIYTRTFTDYDIAISKKENSENGKKDYDVTTKSNYYFMIRETGGIMTGAYVDNRNEPKVLGNPYYDSNIGSEAYLIELGYLTNNNDINNIDKNMDNYVNAIASSFSKVFNSNKVEE